MPSLLAEHVGTLAAGREVLRFAAELEPCSTAAADDALKPQWIHIMPLGPDVEARDGRRFSVSDVESVVRASELPLLVDWEHASEAGDTRAAGWVEELRVEPAEAGSRAGVWGRVAWTDQGRAHVATRHYRFLSPVVVGKRDTRSDSPTYMRFGVERITSVALTNRPALKLHGIEMFREQLSARLGTVVNPETDPMQDQTRRALCAALGLAADASDEQLVGAIKPATEAQSLREACATLTEQLSQAQTETASLKTELAQFRAQAFGREVEAFIADGVRSGKIPPAARETWLKHCQKSTSHFEEFKSTIYPGLAVVIKEGAQAPHAAASGKSERAAFRAPSRNGVDRMALRRLGFTEEQILDAERDVFDPANRAPMDDDDDDDDDDALEGDPKQVDGEPNGGDDLAAQQSGG